MAQSEVAPEKPCCSDAETGAVCEDSTRKAPSPPRTSDFYKCNLPKRFDQPSWFYGYGIQRKPAFHPCYKTTTSDYGRFPPSVHTVPTYFYPKTQDFSKNLIKTGMYRNYSLNTSLK